MLSSLKKIIVGMIGAGTVSKDCIIILANLDTYIEVKAGDLIFSDGDVTTIVSFKKDTASLIEITQDSIRKTDFFVWSQLTIEDKEFKNSDAIKTIENWICEQRKQYGELVSDKDDDYPVYRLTEPYNGPFECDSKYNTIIQTEMRPGWYIVPALRRWFRDLRSEPVSVVDYTTDTRRRTEIVLVETKTGIKAAEKGYDTEYPSNS